MNFFSLDLCKEMQAVGLVSESGFYFSLLGGFELPYVCFEEEELPFRTPAFTAYDLIAPTETARSNARKWWGVELIECAVGCEPVVMDSAYDYYSHQIVDLDTTKESVEDYVRRTRKK